MKKFAFAAFAGFVAIFATFVLSNSAQAYPQVQARLSSDHEIVYGGASFTINAISNVSCTWAIDWNADTTAVSGTEVSTKFVAPRVSKITKLPLTGVCSYVDPSARTTVASTLSPQQLTITVLPALSYSRNAAQLAGTGGPDRAVLISGVLLLFAGATVAMVARRRAEDGELPAQTV
jgi:hypothetical protein